MNEVVTNGPSAKVIADSKFNFTRLITLEIELHRFILPEFNTHRSISRNFQSSRAVPVEKMIEQVRNNPAIPVHWGKNQPGMVAKEELDGDTLEDALGYWQSAAGDAADYAEAIYKDCEVHKQIVNRLLEPFMWTKGVVTATQEAWNVFFELRCHKDAQPEIQALAFKIREAIDNSIPKTLNKGEWHLPYVKEELKIEDAVKVSSSCCGQVSYRKLNDSLEKALKIYDMLNLPIYGTYADDPPHFSPTEHVACAAEQESEEMSGNFHTKDFVQYRKILERGIENAFI